MPSSRAIRPDLILADVSGHGVRAGVVMGMVKSAVRTRLLTPAPLVELMVSVNRVLEQTTSPEMFSTFAVLRIEGTGDSVEYALAGHNLCHYRAREKTILRLQQRHFPLGMLAQSTYDTDRISVGSGDLLALYTDGLNEIENSANEPLGHEPIERFLAEHAQAPLPEIQDGLFALTRRYGTPFDDQSVLLVRIA